MITQGIGFWDSNYLNCVLPPHLLTYKFLNHTHILVIEIANGAHLKQITPVISPYLENLHENRIFHPTKLLEHNRLNSVASACKYTYIIAEFFIFVKSFSQRFDVQGSSVTIASSQFSLLNLK